MHAWASLGLTESSKNPGGNQDVGGVEDYVQEARLGLKTTVLSTGNIHKDIKYPFGEPV